MKELKDFKIGDEVRILKNKKLGIPENKGIITNIDLCDRLDGPPYQVEISGANYWLGEENIKLLKK